MPALTTVLRARPKTALAAALLLALLAWCAVLPPTLPVHRVGRRQLVETVVASGRVRPWSRVRLGAAITGTVAGVLAREGDAVRRNQTLVLLDETEARGSLEQARAAVVEAQAGLEQTAEVNGRMAEARLSQAQATLQKAQADHQRTRALHEDGIVSDEQLDAARQSLAVARSGFEVARLDASSLGREGAESRRARAVLAQARAAVLAAEGRLAHTRIRAPADGAVLTRDVEPGDAVQPGRVLMEMTVRGETQLTAEPDERNLALVRVGQRALASADAFPEQRFPARVSYVSPSVDAQRGTIEVRLTVDDPPAYLRPEMTVSVEIEVGRKSAALVVPADVLRDATSSQPWLMVLRDGRVVRQDVTLGARGENLVEIVSGLAEGEAALDVPAQGVVVGQRARAR